MKVSRKALFLALAGFFPAGLAYAESGYLSEPANVRQVSFENLNYYEADTQAACSDTAAPSAPSAASACGGSCGSSSNSCGCNSGCGCSSCCCGGGFLDRIFDPCCTVGEPKHLFENECWAANNLSVTGYVAASFTGNPQNPGDRFNGPVTWTDRANEFQLNQAVVNITKLAKPEGCCPDWGYNLTTMYGTDSRFNTAAGLETRDYFSSPKWSTQRFYGTAFTQAYLQYAYCDTNIIVGHFYAPVGYEVVNTTANFFSTLPYTFQYGEPFTMTGIYATRKLSDNYTIGAGAVKGWDAFDNTQHNMGAILTNTFTMQNKATLSTAQVWSNEPISIAALGGNGGAGGPERQRYLQTIAYVRPLDEQRTIVLQSDYGFQNDARGLGVGDGKWYGLNSYYFKKVSDCLTLGLRSEWFRDQDGTRVGGFLGTVPSGSNRGLSSTRSGYAGNFYEITAGANYKLNGNSMIRPMVRFDWFESTGAAPAANNLPFNNGNSNFQFLVGGDYFVTF